MAAPRKHPDELRERAIRLAVDARRDPATWWAEEGGRAVSFGSDDHVTAGLAANFHEAIALLDHFGFAPGSRPEDFWTR
ncbi:hypothetical protein SAMN05660748_0079 [Blastococcus aggregatus]|uniref:Uncharacterized protein n=1 Tax=Blastococcus aggregatus TaxID=38502 RepID=A0A285UWU5_9ACTN|nr:hypothetical protein [Blastococcus aggregatus]SOC46157.1 hypothetical protein SAMN05660748_0079 [Blastococcus aggregatus]